MSATPACSHLDTIYTPASRILLGLGDVVVLARFRYRRHRQRADGESQSVG